jgi:hypothetical protein
MRRSKSAGTGSERKLTKAGLVTPANPVPMERSPQLLLSFDVPLALLLLIV